MSRYLRNAAAAVATPPQNQPLNERQVANSAGGFAFPVTDWVRLDRFLILGSEGGSYYASEKKLSIDNLKAVAACVKEDGQRAVARIIEISDAGRAPKNDPALLALAYAAGKGDEKTRAAALAGLPKIARIGTHLFHFVDFVEQFRGWGRGLKSAVQDWYLAQDPEKLADQVTKYQQRDGWSHRDLMRLCHVKGTGVHQDIFRWAVKGLADEAPLRIHGHVQLQAASTAKEAAALIRQYGLVRESVPSEFLKDKEVWAALLEKMPMTATIRNLGNMSKCGLLAPMSDAAKTVVDRLADREAIRKARVHPIAALIAQKTYAAGRGQRGSGEWVPVPQIVDALDDLFYAAFTWIEATGKRHLLGLDVSGSMSMGEVAGVSGLTPRAASAAMCMVTARTESQYYIMAFQDNFVPLSIMPRMRLDDICRHTQNLPFGRTDCSQPMIHAMQSKIPVDVFVVFTDSETWAGNVHPPQALHNYRQAMGINAKLAVMGMLANPFSIADPMDAGMMDFVGFDAAVPALLADFAKA